jgi:hypothetical protein
VSSVLPVTPAPSLPQPVDSASLAVVSSAVIDLRNAIVAGKELLTLVLRKAKVIAASLNLEDTEKCVDF